MNDDESPVVALVEEAVAGSQAAWNCLVARYAPLVIAVVRRYRLSQADAEDVVQTLWLRMVEHLAELREPRALPKWIVTTTKHECLRLALAGQRTQPFDPVAEGSPAADVPTGGAVDEDLLRSERRAALLEGFAELPDHQRRLLALLTQDPQPSYREISLRLNIPIGSIGPTRARALERLRENPAIAALAGTSEIATQGGDRHGTAVGR